MIRLPERESEDSIMFTGLIEILGTCRGVSDSRGGREFLLSCGSLSDGISEGDSVAVNGVCLTATLVGSGEITAFAGRETLSRTTLGVLRPGARVNLERAKKLGDRLGGHLVNGHVDGVAGIISRRETSSMTLFTMHLDNNLAAYVVEKGSVTLDGVSLTVSAKRPPSFSVAVIPFTMENTTLSERRSGHKMNLEVDILAKYVESLLSAGNLRKRHAF